MITLNDSIKTQSVNIDYIYIKIPKSLWLGDLLILEIIIPNKFLLYLFFVIHCITM